MDKSEFMNGKVTISKCVSATTRAPNHFPDLIGWHQSINRVILHKIIPEPTLGESRKT